MAHEVIDIKLQTKIKSSLMGVLLAALLCPAAPALAAEHQGRQAFYAALGDTVEKIACLYDLDSELVAAMNNTQPGSRLLEGQRIWLPLEPVQSYTVQAGDTLWSLARKFDSGVAELAAANNILAEGVLSIGQVLQLPAASTAVGSPYRMVLAQEGLSSRGSGLAWPLSGVISSSYGWRSRGWHCGLDIAADYGSYVYAAQSGLVKQAGWRSSAYGNTVALDHGGGLVTLYAHNSQLLVTEGQFVRQGQAIALVGDSGNATGAHVHLEVRLNNVCQDPKEYLR